MGALRAAVALALLAALAAATLIPLALAPLRIPSPVAIVRAQPAAVTTGSGASPTFVQVNVTDPSTSATLLMLSSTGSYTVQAGQNASYSIPVPPVNVVQITITERSGNALTGYAVQVVLNSTNFGGWSLINSTNLYFVDANGNPLYYWVEHMDTAAQKASIWVRIPYLAAGGSVTIYMLYGGSNPYSTYNNPRQVFPFYYDWVGATSVGWGVNNPTGSASASVYNGMLRLYAPSVSINVYRAYTTSSGYAMRLRAYKDTASGWAAGFGDGTILSTSLSDWKSGYVFRVGTSIEIRVWSNGSLVTSTSASFPMAANTVYIQECRWYGTTLENAVYASDGASLIKSVSLSSSTFTSLPYLQIGNEYSNLYVSWVIVRPYVRPEPAVSVAALTPSVRVLVPAGLSIVNVTRSDGAAVAFAIQPYNATHKVVSFSAAPGFSHTVYATARNAVAAASAQNGYAYFPRGGAVTVFASIADPFGNPLAQTVYFSLFRADTGALISTAVATSNSSGIASAVFTLLNADLKYYVRVETNGTYAGLSYFTVYTSSVVIDVSDIPSVASKGTPFSITISAYLTVDGSPADLIGVNGAVFRGPSATLTYQFNASGRFTLSLSVWAAKDAVNTSTTLSRQVVVGGSIRWWLYSAASNGTAVSVTVTALYDDGTTAAGTAVALVNGSQATSGGLPITVTLASAGLYNITLSYVDVDGSAFSDTMILEVAQLGDSPVLRIPPGAAISNPTTLLNVTFARGAYISSLSWRGGYLVLSGQADGDDSPVTLGVKADGANLTVVQLYKSKTSSFVLSAPSGAVSTLSVSYANQFRAPPQAVRVSSGQGQTIIYASSFLVDPNQFAAAPPPAVYVDLVSGSVSVKVQHASDVSVDLYWEFGAAAPGQAAQSAVLNFPISPQYVGSPTVFVGAIPQAVLPFATTYALYTGSSRPAYSFPFSAIPATILIFEPAAPSIPSYTVYWNQPSNPYGSYTVSTTSGVFGAYDDFDYQTALWSINGSYAYSGSLLWLYPNTALTINATLLPDDSFTLFRILVYAANATFVYGYANISIQPDGVFLCAADGCRFVCSVSPVMVLGFGAYYDSTDNRTTYYVLAVDSNATMHTSHAVVEGSPGAQPFHLYLGSSILALDRFAVIYGLYARLLATGQASFSVSGPYSVQTLIKMISLQTPTIIQYAGGSVNVYAGGQTGITFIGFAGFIASISVGAVTMSNIPITSDVWIVDVPLGYTAMLIVDPVNRVLSLMSATPIQPPAVFSPAPIQVVAPPPQLAPFQLPPPSVSALIWYAVFAAVAVAAYALGLDVGLAIAVAAAAAAIIGAATGDAAMMATGIAVAVIAVAFSYALRK